jgi:hypothetical protein
VRTSDANLEAGRYDLNRHERREGICARSRRGHSPAGVGLLIAVAQDALASAVQVLLRPARGPAAKQTNRAAPEHPVFEAVDPQFRHGLT